MGRELINGYSVFRDSIQAANRYLQTLGCQWDLLGMDCTTRERGS